MRDHDTTPHPDHDHDVTVEVDGELVTSPRETTVGDLLQAAHLDPAARKLVLLHGRKTTEYPDPTVPLELHPHERFITIATGPTPVS